MELLDRYLHAVKFWLPRKQQDDIIAEISEDLRSQIEDSEGQLGRKLNDNEVAALLRKRGRPLLVANGYSPQHSLIGPVLFPIYILVLKIAAVVFVVPRVLTLLGFFFFDPKSHVQGVGALIGRMWSEVWIGIFFAFGMVTLVFAILEQTQQKSGWLEKWDPLKLPRAKDTRKIPRASSIFEVVFGIIALMWLLEVAISGVLLSQTGVRIALTPVGHNYVWIITVLSAFGIGLSWVNLFRPFWTRSRLFLRVIQDAASTLLFGLMARAGALIVLSGPNVPEARAAEFNAGVNPVLSISMASVGLICAVIMIVDLVRLITMKTNQPPLPKQVSGAATRLSC
jgi:hypothetical protein